VYFILKFLKWVVPLVLLLVFITSCGEAADESTAQATPTETTPAQTPTTSETVTPTSGNGDEPTEEPSDSEPLVAFMVAYTGWHNYFTFEIVNNRLLYQAIRYDYYPLDTDSINNVRPGDYIAYVGNTFNLSNDCFLVYVTSGKLHYKVINPYAIPGPDPERCSMGAVHEGILEGYATSIAVNYVRFTYWGKYGVHVNWTDNYGKGHYAVIDQWEGVTEKGYSAADDRPQMVDPIARGRMVRPPDHLEDWKQTQESAAPGAVVNWVREDENHLELKFDPAGGTVTGSFWFQQSMDFGYQDADPDHPTTTITMTQIGDLTGTYSGGETGSFEGDVTGTRTNAFNGVITDETNCTIEGTWMAEMDADGHITGYLHYTVTCSDATYEDWFDFEATMSR
jgi:hypothetical protein